MARPRHQRAKLDDQRRAVTAPDMCDGEPAGRRAEMLNPVDHTIPHYTNRTRLRALLVNKMKINDPDALFALAVATLMDVDTFMARKQVDEPAWDAIDKLQRTGSHDVLAMCAVRCASPDPRERRVAAAVLGQLGVSDRQTSTVFRDERFEALRALLLAEIVGPADVQVLAAACLALGHLNDTRAISSLAALRAHPDPDVRFAVALGLSGHNTDEAVTTLIDLSVDADAQVRNWATFGLGQQVDRDTPAIRAALTARLTDPNLDTRQEAYANLAALGEVLTVQRFTMLPDLTIEASFCCPSQIGDGVWCCEHRVRWPGCDVRSRAYGLDGLRALLLAMALTHRSLVAEAASRSDDEPSLSPTNAHSSIDWAGAGALCLGQASADEFRVRLLDRTDRDDLMDRIVLAECGPQFFKVARVAGAALHAIGHRSRSARLHGEMGDDLPAPILEIVLARLARLVALVH